MKSSMSKRLILVCSFLYTCQLISACAGAGTLDTTFNVIGSVKIHLFGTPALWAVAAQSDNKIVVAGWLDSSILLMRYNRDGSLDKTFNDSGVLLSVIKDYNFAYLVAVQPDNKIVVAGLLNSFFAVARYNSDGSLDKTFNGTGAAIIDSFEKVPPINPRSISLQHDGKIVVIGSTVVEGASDYVVIRYNVDGALDCTFNPQGALPGVLLSTLGSVTAGADSIVIQEDGKLVVSGHADAQLVLVRYNLDGSLDTTFHGTGILKTGLSSLDSRVKVKKNGKIVVAATIADRSNSAALPQKLAVIQYMHNGSLDRTFNRFSPHPGMLFSDAAESVQVKSLMLQKNGKIVVAGTTGNNNAPQALLACYGKDGMVDTTFNSCGTKPGIVMTTLEETTFKDATLDCNDNILLIGDTYDKGNNLLVVARYHGAAVR